MAYPLPKYPRVVVVQISRIVLVFLFVIPSYVRAQPVQGTPIPKLVLSETDGGKLGGGAWKCSDEKGKPCLLVLIHPDRLDLLSPIDRAVAESRLNASEGSLVKVMDTRLSWKPDGMIQAGAWLGQIAGKWNEARESGIIQALFTDRKNKPASWTVVYDQNQVIRSKLKLNDRPVHIFLLDKRGIIISYFAGLPTDSDARLWVQMMKKLGV